MILKTISFQNLQTIIWKNESMYKSFGKKLIENKKNQEFPCLLCLLIKITISRKIVRGGGEYLVYLFDRDVPFFRVSFSPICYKTGYQKKAIFLDPVVKTCQKGEFC